MKEVIRIPVIEVIVPPRARQDMGDIDALAESIKQRGLLHPIGITDANILIFGERRLRAHKKLGKTEIEASIIDVENLAEAERDENEMRKDFTPSERVAVGKAIEEQIGKRQGQRTDKELPTNWSEVHKGEETKQLAAKKAGFGGRSTYERAKKVVERGVPELVEAMDEQKISIAAAAVIADHEPEVQAEIVKAGPEAVTREASRMQSAPKEKRTDPKVAKQSVKVSTIAKMIEDLVELASRPQHRYPYVQLKKQAEDLRAAFARSFGGT